ncbi:pentatricopeptide repeat protein [Perilla frutescens var. hirtella]|nr:pentatricopeptide repeat protein [Perilla frutescens var. hirtella]
MGKSCSKSLFLTQFSLQITHTRSLRTAGGGAAADSFIALCRQGHLKQAFTAHFSLISWDPPLVSHLLKACVDSSSLSLAQQLHSIITTNGWSNIKFVSNHLMSAYAKLCRLETALKVFDKMPERNVMSYNIVIGGYIQSGDLGAAVEVFKEMGERKNSATWNAVITGMIKNELNEEGLTLFAQMHSNEFSSDAYTLGSVLRACAGLKDLIKGKQVHGYAMRLGLELDLVVGNSTSHMYMRCGCLSEAERVIQSMPLRNIVLCNTLIAGLVQNGCAAGALETYHLIKRAGFRPDDISFVSVVASCSKLSTLGQGQQIHAEVVKAGAASDAAVITSLISMYSRCGCLDGAVKAFEERGGAARCHVLLSSMIAAYGFHGKGDEAIELFKSMELDGVKANKVTFLSLLYSCSHCGLKEKGLQLFNLMIGKYGLQPEVKHYTCVVDLLSRAGCLEEAERFIRSMPVKPDAVTWKTLLSACKIHKTADMATRIAEEILKIDPQDSASYVLLSNIQATADRWRDVSTVRKQMRERMVKKEPGVSWYELKNEVHHFIMGDKSHPQWEEINSYLKEVMAEVRSHGYVTDIGASLHDMDSEEKEHNLAHHSEKLAVAFALMKAPDSIPIRIMKNLRVCDDCHVVMKYISMVRNREIVLRDCSRFHHFKHGHCSCGDYW